MFLKLDVGSCSSDPTSFLRAAYHLPPVSVLVCLTFSPPPKAALIWVVLILLLFCVFCFISVPPCPYPVILHAGGWGFPRWPFLSFSDPVSAVHDRPFPLALPACCGWSQPLSPGQPLTQVNVVPLPRLGSHARLHLFSCLSMPQPQMLHLHLPPAITVKSRVRIPWSFSCQPIGWAPGPLPYPLIEISKSNVYGSLTPALMFKLMVNRWQPFC